MQEISVILKNNILISVEEFRILDSYTCHGKIWSLIERRDNGGIVKLRTVEYIFDPESFLLFRIISNNILAQWDTSLTKNLRYNEEFNIKDSLYIRPYNKDL